MLPAPQVYEEKRRESLEILEDAHAKRADIERLLKGVDDRLAELSGEMAELEQFLALDRRRKALEYTLYSSELLKAQKGLDELAMQNSEVCER